MRGAVSLVLLLVVVNAFDSNGGDDPLSRIKADVDALTPQAPADFEQLNDRQVRKWVQVRGATAEHVSNVLEFYVKMRKVEYVSALLVNRNTRKGYWRCAQPSGATRFPGANTSPFQYVGGGPNHVPKELRTEKHRLTLELLTGMVHTEALRVQGSLPSWEDFAAALKDLNENVGDAAHTEPARRAAELAMRRLAPLYDHTHSEDMAHYAVAHDAIFDDWTNVKHVSTPNEGGDTLRGFYVAVDACFKQHNYPEGPRGHQHVFDIGHQPGQLVGWNSFLIAPIQHYPRHALFCSRVLKDLTSAENGAGQAGAQLDVHVTHTRLAFEHLCQLIQQFNFNMNRLMAFVARVKPMVC